MTNMMRKTLILLALLALAVASVACLNSDVSAKPAPAPTDPPGAPVVLAPTPVTPPALAGLSPSESLQRIYGWYIDAPFEVNAYEVAVEQGYLTDELVRRVAEIRASWTQGGGYDVLLCAQDRPNYVNVEQMASEGDWAEAELSSSFPNHRFAVELERVDGVWRIADVHCTPPQAAGGRETAPTVAAPTGAPPVNDGERQIYQNAEYGLHLAYPAGWVYEEVTADPSRPPLGPDNLKLMVLLMPEAWAAQKGVPDPNGPGVAPFSFEVSVGSMEAYRQAHPEPDESEPVTLNGLEATREVEYVNDELYLVRYMVAWPGIPERRLTVTDAVSGFSERIQGNEAVVAELEATLQTLSLTP
jgi:hypothetical protein